jgi:hypothetical protein
MTERDEATMPDAPEKVHGDALADLVEDDAAQPSDRADADQAD